MRIHICLLVFLFISPTFAQGKYSAGLGLGATDNANLEEQGRDSDVFLKAFAQASGDFDSHVLGLRLTYVDYQSQNTNDNLSWRLMDKYAPDSSAWLYSGALLGRNYTKSEPGFTESAFNFVGWDLKAERMRPIATSSEMNYGPGARARYYSGAGDRSDHQLYGFADFNFEKSSQVSFGITGELGWLSSSDSNYSMIAYDLGLSLEYNLMQDLSWYNELSIGNSMFTRRTVDVITTVSRRRGVASTNLTKANENYSMISLLSELTKTITPNLDGKVSLNSFSNTSKSGYQDYNVLELYTSLVWRL